jgi:thiol:disulfide interchange protein DsbA
MFLNNFSRFTVRLSCWLAMACLLTLAACESPEQAAQAPAAPAAEATAESTATNDATTELEAMTDVAEETEGLDAVVVASEEIVLEEVATAAPATQDWKFSEGEHFRRMTTAQGTSSAPDKIEVAEVFWYGCPHCYDFDPILSEWEQSKASDVSFVRIPVIWNPTNQVHARLMYTAEALGVLPQVHEAIFESIHQRGNMLTAEADMIELFAAYDIDETAFKEAYQSFGVTSAVKRAENLTRRYQIRSVPVVVINGKYATDAPGVKSFGDMIAVTNELVERERSGP